VVVHESGTLRVRCNLGLTPLPLSGPPLSSRDRMQLAVLHRSPPVRPSVSGDHVGSVGHLHPRETGKLIFLGMRERARREHRCSSLSVDFVLQKAAEHHLRYHGRDPPISIFALGPVGDTITSVDTEDVGVFQGSDMRANEEQAVRED